jgi:hypothetical protein
MKGRELRDFRRSQALGAGLIPCTHDGMPTDELRFHRMRCPHCTTHWDIRHQEYATRHLIVKHGEASEEACRRWYAIERTMKGRELWDERKVAHGIDIEQEYYLKGLAASRKPRRRRSKPRNGGTTPKGKA